MYLSVGHKLGMGSVLVFHGSVQARLVSHDVWLLSTLLVLAAAAVGESHTANVLQMIGLWG